MSADSNIDPDFFKKSQLSLTEQLYKITQGVLDENNINYKIDLEKIQNQANKEDNKSLPYKNSLDHNNDFFI
ncbi:MAG: hypothetical protein WC860_03645 [Candidatus Margulisiibacteriota bacterium]|jgi:hypothetical protein